MKQDRPTADSEHRALASGQGDGLLHTYLVEAGAGTGKTTVLIDRLLALIRSGVPVHRIVAITFTEKAAGELKIRLREELEEAAREAETAVLAEALHQIDRAQVSTIHGFCSTLLKERPVEAGVDPNFGVADEFRRTVVLEAVWDAWLRKQFSESLPECVADAEALGHGLDRIHELAMELVAQRDLLDMVPEPVEPGDVDALADEFASEAAAFAGLARTACRNMDDRALPEIEDFAAQARMIEHVPAAARASYVLTQVTPRPIKNGAKGNWDDGVLDDIKARVRAMRERQGAFRERLAHNATVGLVQWLRGFVEEYEREKSRQGLLDFEDLLLKARDLVRDNLEVREDFKRAFDHILLDEFQDTDPLQCELAFFLCEVEGGGASRWSEVELQPGRLFLVGDPKQSIYRFRRADIETYELAREMVDRSGSVLELVENFRTRPEIVDAVNAAFEGVMHRPEDGRSYQPDYAALSAFRERAAVGPGVVLLPPPGPLDELYADDVRAAEARAVAAFIADVAVGGAVRVFDRGAGDWRPAELRDVAILFHRTNALDAYEEAFGDYGIDYRVAGGKRFYARREVRELATVLAAVEDPHNLAAVVGALRTPFFGASDEDILLHRHRAGTLSYVSNESSGVAAVDDAMALLRDLHHDRSSLGTPRLIRELFDRTNALELFLMKPSGEQRHANLVKVAEIAEQLTRDGALSFGGFVRWLADVQQLTPTESESPLSEEGDDFVRMLTIHRAKGLEFPVVVLADLSHYRAQDDSVVVDRELGRLEFGLGPKDNRLGTTGYEELRQSEGLRRNAELIRLLYVGATRARDALVVPWFTGGKWQTGSGLLEHLEAMRESAAGPVPDLASAAREPGPLSFETAALDLDRKSARPSRLRAEGAAAIDPATTVATRERTEWLAWRDGYGERHHRPAEIVSPSSMEAEEEAAAQEMQETQAAQGAQGPQGAQGAPAARDAAPLDAAPLPDGVTAADLGTLVHSVMERTGPGGADTESADSEAIAAMAGALARTAGLPDEAACEAARIVRRGLSAPIMKRARSARACWSEVPFCVEDGGRTVEGKIDLLFEDEGGLVVVDYKTDLVGAEGPEAHAARYHAQGAAYARAVSSALGRPVSEVVLLFMRKADEVRIPLP